MEVTRAVASQKKIGAVFPTLLTAMFIQIDLVLDGVPKPRLGWVLFDTVSLFYLVFFCGEIQNWIVGWYNRIEKFKAHY